MEQIIYSLQEYKFLVAIVGFVIIIIETFIPALPLVAIVGANAFVLGIWVGFFISWVGSSIGSIALFFLCNKFAESTFIRKISDRYKNIEKFNNYIKYNSKFIIF